ncbi:hypothetical protein HaLaN_19549, partial [Haematococcus lacustris]
LVGGALWRCPLKVCLRGSGPVPRSNEGSRLRATVLSVRSSRATGSMGRPFTCLQPQHQPPNKEVKPNKNHVFAEATRQCLKCDHAGSTGRDEVKVKRPDPRRGYE